MANKKKENGDPIDDQLNRLEKQGRIPFIMRAAKTPQRRWQKRTYPSGVNYARPVKPEEMGRYNDPTGRTGICYTADFAVAAIAESLGRIYQRKPEAFFLGLEDLQTAHIYSLETTRATKIIDMVRLQALLHLTANQIMGEDYSITQAITSWAVNTPGLDYDGIAYLSRHLGTGTCTAYWIRDGRSDPLADVVNSPADEYIDTAVENFPQNWTEDDISGFEIVTETLNYRVSG
ncbi:RES family NAD+ phosphorylase [Pantoea osteomyelitidis]|uniref:RES family NAD+ phosphorylase n=1 Tax=Pantoea osteomyelitidis TaxID=3230026 RepID=A0ABW7Q2P9_9GAMM